MSLARLASFGFVMSLLIAPVSAIAEAAHNDPMASLARVPLDGTPFSATGNFEEITNRNIQEQQQIEQGLRSGQLTPAEAIRLERGEARIDRTEARALENGNLSMNEVERLTTEQNKEAARIQALESNRMTAPPSPLAQELETDIQHNITRQEQLENELISGHFARPRVFLLEEGRPKVSVLDTDAFHNNLVNLNDPKNLHRAENHQVLMKDNRDVLRKDTVGPEQKKTHDPAPQVRVHVFHVLAKR